MLRPVPHIHWWERASHQVADELLRDIERLAPESAAVAPPKVAVPALAQDLKERAEEK